MDKLLKLWKQECEAEGLLALGVVDLEVGTDWQRYQQWLAEGRQGELAYLERNQTLRQNPAQLLPGAKVCLLVALPYATEGCASPQVARYARFRDYHRELRQRVENAWQRFLQAEKLAASARICVDSAPLLERALHAKAASGFIGKNTCFISPQAGSFLLLAEILSDISLPLDQPAVIDSQRKTKSGGCGPCQLCQVACPTGALDSDYQIDARKCLAYWTIEHRGEIPLELWAHFSDYWFGCDLCQTACPYNKVAAPLPANLKLRELPPLDRVVQQSEAQYQEWFGGTAMTRAKREGLQRNALIALAVTRHPRYAEALTWAEGNGGEVLRATARTARDVYPPRGELGI